MSFQAIELHQRTRFPMYCRNKLCASLPNDVLSTIKSDAISIAQTQVAEAIPSTTTMIIFASLKEHHAFVIYDTW